MITYDENGNTIATFLNRYNSLKSAFAEFKKIIRSEISSNSFTGISFKNETEIYITLEFIDREFMIEFSIIKKSESNFMGKIIFSVWDNGDAH